MASSTLKGIGEAKTYDGSSLRIGILHARWNAPLITALLSGTISTLKKSGVKEENIVVQSVPGSYELPLGVQRMYQASQTQAASATIGGALGALGQAAGDLLGGSTSDLTALDNKSAGAGEKGSGGKEAKSGSAAGGDGPLNVPFDAIIAIGALIKGSTMHFEYISDAVSHGLMKVQLETGCPVIFGLLTLLNEEQGKERAGIDEAGKGHNHGEDWGAAAVELAVKRKGWGDGTFVE